MEQQQSVAGACWQCLICFGSIIFSIIFFIALFKPTSKPSCSISQFYIPALNTSANYTSNHSIFFQLRLFNPDTLRGAYYDPINLTVNYASSISSTVPFANQTLPGFHQGRLKTKRISESLQANGIPWESVERNGSLTVRLRVDLATSVNYKLFTSTKRKKFVVGADLEVNADGVNSGRKSIKMNSGRPEVVYRPWFGIFVLLLTLTVF